MTRTRVSHRLGGSLLLLGVLVAVPACSSNGSFTLFSDGNFNLFGYTTAPNYDMRIRTVYVPIFKNTTYLVNRQIEFQLTDAVVREIESKTPYKVESCRDKADSELLGTIVSRSKAPTVINPLGEIRDLETTVTVELYWKDLRVGHLGEPLSLTRIHRPDEPVIPIKPGDKLPPVIVQSLAQFTPELGTSAATAQKTNVDRLAVQIVSMMEVWRTP